MPVDADGNRADIVFDPNSTISRMNQGRFYEQYINGSSRDTHRKLCAMLGVAPQTKAEYCINEIRSLPNHVIENAWNYLRGFYEIINPIQNSWIDNLSPGDIHEVLSQIVEKPVIGVYFPTDNELYTEDICLGLETHYKPCYGPVTYTGNSGQKVTTRSYVRIGSVYIILLEKTGDDWSSVASGKLQHFGVLSQLTKTDKYSKPVRNQAVRGTGEAELRILVSYIGSEFVAELMDRNNSPKTHKHIVAQLLTADQPSNIENLVDRQAIPYGGSKPLNLVHHLMQCSGAEFEYQPYVPNYLKPIQQLTDGV